MLDAIFRLLFNYRPVVFQQGEFRFVPSTGSYIAAVVVVAAIAITFLTYRRTRSEGRRAASRGARGDPARDAPRSSSSASSGRCSSSRRPSHSRTSSACSWTTRAACRLPTSTASRASAFARQHFAAPDADVLKTLSSRFVMRTFRFSSTAQRLASPAELTFGGAQTKHRRGARWRAPGAGRSSARRPGRRERRRRHDRCRAHRRAAGDEGGRRSGVHGRARSGIADQGRADRSRVDARVGAQGHVADGRRARHADRLRRRDGHARRRGRRPHRRVAGGEAADRRRAGGRARPLHGVRSGSARVSVPDRAAAGRARDAEQPARGAGRRLRPDREDPVFRRRAAARDEVPAPRRRRRQEPAGRDAAADGGQQVLPARCSTRRSSWRPASPRRATSSSPTAA